MTRWLKGAETLSAFAKSAFSIVLLLGMVGCATQTSPPTQTLGLEEFVRHGRFAVRTEASNQDPEAVQGGFVWRDKGGALTLDLTNPFGNTLARVVVLPGQSTLTQSNGEMLRASSPDELVRQAIGQSVPVRDLRAWLRTPLRVLPGMQQVTRDDQGRIVGFEQAGWTAELSRFDSLGPGLLLLSRMDGTKKVQIRLVVDIQ